MKQYMVFNHYKSLGKQKIKKVINTSHIVDVNVLVRNCSLESLLRISDNEC